MYIHNASYVRMWSVQSRAYYSFVLLPQIGTLAQYLLEAYITLKLQGVRRSDRDVGTMLIGIKL